MCTTDGHCVNEDPSGRPDAATEPDANCPAVHVAATKVTPSIQLLIDRSGSMLETFVTIPPDTDIPKYVAVQDALVGADGIVPRLQADVYFGASMYPSDNCPAIITQGRALNNNTAIDTLLRAAINKPAGEREMRNRNTPTAPSIDAVVADFKANPPPQGSPPVIVLATDGVPNACNGGTSTTAQSVAAAKRAFEAGIKLYILSVGTIAGADQHLQDMANAGLGVQAGQPNAAVFKGTDPAGLASAFQQIIGGVLSCDLTLDQQIDPSDAPKGTVTLNGDALTFGTDWTVDDEGLKLSLIGNACTRLKNTTAPVVDAEFPCGVIVE